MHALNCVPPARPLRRRDVRVGACESRRAALTLPLALPALLLAQRARAADSGDWSSPGLAKAGPDVKCVDASAPRTAPAVSAPAHPPTNPPTATCARRTASCMRRLPRAGA